MLEVADDLHWALAKFENPDMDKSIMLALFAHVCTNMKRIPWLMSRQFLSKVIRRNILKKVNRGTNA